MKHLLLTTIAAVVLVGCGSSVDIWEAAKEGNIEAGKQAIADGADVNARDEEGRAPLHYAATKEVAELLIDKGADVNVKVASGPRQGGTPLDDAIKWKDTEIVDLLRKHGGKTGDELKAEGK